VYAIVLAVLVLVLFVLAASELTLTSAAAAAVEEVELAFRFFARGGSAGGPSAMVAFFLPRGMSFVQEDEGLHPLDRQVPILKDVRYDVTRSYVLCWSGISGV